MNGKTTIDISYKQQLLNSSCTAVNSCCSIQLLTSSSGYAIVSYSNIPLKI